MNKRMFWMLVLTALVFGGIFGFKWFGNKMMNQFFDNMPAPPATISSAVASSAEWTDRLEAVGTIVAVNGAQVTTEAAGVVDSIRFESGQEVKAGTVLLTLDTRTDIAELKALSAQAELARNELARFERLYGLESISKAELDRRQSEYDQAAARAAAQQARIAQKTIRAPFSGELGIRQVNLGQFVAPGNPIVSLQSLDPVYVNFSLPEQNLARLREGLVARLSVDAYPGEIFEGRISAIEPEVDTATRNVRIQATVPNPQRKLRPGMFSRLSLDFANSRTVILVPRTAISFAPFGNSVYVVTETGEGEQKSRVVKRRFVKTGEIRGDLVEVTEGLKAGEEIASSGLLKLQNDTRVTINNSVQPSAEEAPTPPNS
ncbi:MAG: efflux RND transporter periplasmic adaptor subunit [Gammaproteobacteria bacterium]